MKKLLLLLFLLLPQLALAQPVFVVGAANSGDTVASVLISVTPSGSDRLLLGVVITAGTGVDSTNISAVHFNTTEALTAVLNDVSADNEFHGHLYRRIAPSTGAHDLQVDFVAGDSVGLIAGLVFSGTHQTVPLGTAVGQGSASFVTDSTIDVTSAVNEIVVDAAGTGSLATIGYGAGQTSVLTNVYLQFTASTKAGAGTVNMTRTWDGSAERAFLLGVSVKPAAAAGGAILRRPRIRLE
jgi:hypothetical protein